MKEKRIQVNGQAVMKLSKKIIPFFFFLFLWTPRIIILSRLAALLATRKSSTDFSHRLCIGLTPNISNVVSDLWGVVFEILSLQCTVNCHYSVYFFY